MSDESLPYHGTLCLSVDISFEYCTPCRWNSVISWKPERRKTVPNISTRMMRRCVLGWQFTVLSPVLMFPCVFWLFVRPIGQVECCRHLQVWMDLVIVANVMHNCEWNLFNNYWSQVLCTVQVDFRHHLQIRIGRNSIKYSWRDWWDMMYHLDGPVPSFSPWLKVTMGTGGLLQHWLWAMINFWLPEADQSICSFWILQASYNWEHTFLRVLLCLAYSYALPNCSSVVLASFQTINRET